MCFLKPERTKTLKPSEAEVKRSWGTEDPSFFVLFLYHGKPWAQHHGGLGAQHRFSRTSQFFSICVASVARSETFSALQGEGISDTKCTQVARQLDHRSLRDVHKVQRFVCLNLRFIQLFSPFELVFVVCFSLCLMMIVLNYILCLPLKDSFPFQL